MAFVWNRDDSPGKHAQMAFFDVFMATQVKQPRSYATVYGKLRRNTWFSITIVYFRVVYEDIRQHTKKDMVVYGPRIQSSYTIFVSLRTSP